MGDLGGVNEVYKVKAPKLVVILQMICYYHIRKDVGAMGRLGEFDPLPSQAGFGVFAMAHITHGALAAPSFFFPWVFSG